MISAVLDASAVIALLRDEPGADQLWQYLPNGLLSAVNLAEVFSKSVDIQLSLEQAKWSVQRLQVRHVPFESEQAYIAGSLREPTRDRGLSLGDRACLALGIVRQIPVVTRERIWAELDLGVEVLVIR